MKHHHGIQFTEEFQSPNRRFSFDFGAFGEVAMGAFCVGELYLVTKLDSYLIPGNFLNTILWNEVGNQAALVNWERRAGKSFNICIIDVTVTGMTVYYYKNRFATSKIAFNTFKNNILTGTENKHQFIFNIDTEPIEQETNLEK